MAALTKRDYMCSIFGRYRTKEREKKSIEPTEVSKFIEILLSLALWLWCEWLGRGGMIMYVQNTECESSKQKCACDDNTAQGNLSLKRKVNFYKHRLIYIRQFQRRCVCLHLDSISVIIFISSNMYRFYAILYTTNTDLLCVCFSKPNIQSTQFFHHLLH